MNRKPSTKVSVSKNRRSTADMEEEDASLLSDCLKIMDSIFDMRFV